jgi:acyl-coenzyme A thioesterase PaaI-like protein
MSAPSRVLPIAGTSAEAGQASVELAVLAPLLAAVALAGAQLLAAGAAATLADHAAEAAAVALLQGADPAAAARAAVPGWSRRRMTVDVRGRRVLVRLRPPAPVAALGGLLEASGEADAGPAPP